MKTGFRALLLALTVYAAASFAASPKIDEAALAAMRKGQTTFDEVVRRFGRPNFSSTNWDGERTAAYAYGEGWSPAALSALGAALGGSGSDTVVLHFNGRGLLTDYQVSRAVAKPGEAPATPTVRYVEPPFGGTKPASPAKPAAATLPATPAERHVEPGPGGGTPPSAAKSAGAAAATAEATPLAPVPASKPAATQTAKPQRSDGLPSWLPSSSSREERY